MSDHEPLGSMAESESAEKSSGVTNQLVCLWCGPVSLALFVIGFVVIARFIPPLPPSDTASMTAAIFRDRSFEIKVGMILVQIALGLWLPWGVSLVGRVKLIENNRVPTLTYVQLGAVIVTTTQLVLMSIFWAVAAFRADDTSPQIIQVLNDVGWFFLLFCFVPLTIWVASMAPPILQDTAPSPTYPRWVGYLSIWVALLLLPGGILVFFKQGPFSWNGLFPCYIPLAAFFLWFGVLTFYTLKAVRTDFADEASR